MDMNYIVLACYLVAIFLGISGFTIGTLAKRKNRTKLNSILQLFMVCIIVVCLYDLILYYTGYIVGGLQNVELLRMGDCIIAVLFYLWLVLQQRLVEEDVLEKYYVIAKVYVAAYAVIWAIITLVFDVKIMYGVKWVLLVSDIVLILMMVVGSITYIVAAIYRKAESKLIVCMVIVTAMITWNYASYLWGEASVYWGNSSFIRDPLDLTIVFWLTTNVTMMIFIYKKAFLEAYGEQKEKHLISVEEVLNQVKEKYDLTERERDLVALIYEGNSNSEIAAKLFISESTVKTHIYKIFKKMNIKNRMSIMKIVREKQEKLNAGM